MLWLTYTPDWHVKLVHIEKLVHMLSRSDVSCKFICNVVARTMNRHILALTTTVLTEIEGSEIKTC